MNFNVQQTLAPGNAIFDLRLFIRAEVMLLLPFVASLPIWTTCVAITCRRSVHPRSQKSPLRSFDSGRKLSMITETGPRIFTEKGPLFGGMHRRKRSPRRS